MRLVKAVNIQIIVIKLLPHIAPVMFCTSGKRLFIVNDIGLCWEKCYNKMIAICKWAYHWTTF